MKRMGIAKPYFLGMTKIIEDLTARGFSLKSTYMIIQPPMGYRQFTRYVQAYIGAPGQNKKKGNLPPGLNPATAKPANPTAQPPKSSPTSSTTKDKDDKKFHWNPTPNREELI